MTRQLSSAGVLGAYKWLERAPLVSFRTRLVKDKTFLHKSVCEGVGGGGRWWWAIIGEK